MRQTAVLILGAGRGTRMMSQRPKVLHGAGGRSLLDNVLAAVAAAGFAAADTAVVAGFGFDAVAATVEPRGIRVVRQDPPRGTGDAVHVAYPWWHEYRRLVVLHGDMPLVSAATIAALAHHHEAHPAVVVLATATPQQPRAYGRILREVAHPDRVQAIVEDNQATPEQKNIRELNAGFYCFDTLKLAAALAALGTGNPHGEYYLTDTIAWIAAHRGVALALPLADESECLGVNDRVELAQIDRLLRRRKAEAVMRAGATVQLPETVTIDPEVEVGADTVLESGVQLLGTTRVGANCTVRSCSILENTVLGDGVLIRPHCVLESATVEAGAQLGPYTRLREGARIGAGARLGNFVEVKNSNLGAGVKANHLAYLGDAAVGAGVNIGAGTITCNFDGREKHPTTLGEGAFVGSNSTLVAPVEIGAGAYIAAGSVITESVPPAALALGRSRQVNKPGWRPRGSKAPAAGS